MEGAGGGGRGNGAGDGGYGLGGGGGCRLSREVAGLGRPARYAGALKRCGGRSGVVYGTLRVYRSFCMVVASTGRKAGFPALGAGKRKVQRIDSGEDTFVNGCILEGSVPGGTLRV